MGSGRRKKPSGSWTPTLFEAELLSLDIGLINSRPYHPQTNGNLERFRRSVEEEVWRYACLDDYIGCYNTGRLHWALDIDDYETPLMAFRNKTATDDIRSRTPKCMEADINADPRFQYAHTKPDPSPKIIRCVKPPLLAAC